MSEEIYREYCKKRGVKKAHPDVLKCIREGSVASLDFSETYLGNRGLLAVLDMLEHLPECRELNLKSQKIYNTDLSPTSVKGNVMLERLMEVASRHPSLSSLTLSDNPLSNLAGRRLLDLIAKNELITSVAVDDTYIDADLCKMISGACGKNAAKAGPRQPVPPPDPAATGSKRPAVSLPEAGDRPTGGEDPADDPFSFAKSEDPFVPGRRQSSITDTQANDMLKLGGLKKHRKTVAAPAVSMEDAKNYKPPTFPKSADELAKLVTFLKANLLFSHLASEDVETCAHAMDKITFKKGDTPCVREVEGDSLYILTSGSANVLKENPENPEEEVVVWTKAADGDAVFGELELMYDHPCTATITIATDAAEAWKMGREDYQNLVMGSAIRKREIHMENLKNIKFLSDMGHADLVQLADALETNEWEAGDYIIRYGTEGGHMYLVVSGEVEVIGRQDDQDTVVCTFGAGDNFGELEFLNDHKCVADVRAVTKCKTARINRAHFELCLGPVKGYLRDSTRSSTYDYYRQKTEVEN